MKDTEKTGVETEKVVGKKTRNDSKDSSQAKTFIVAVADLTWQMAIVVLIPIVGGYKLDKYLGTTPLLTIVGFIIAMGGTFLVIKRVQNVYGQRFVNSSKGNK